MTGESERSPVVVAVGVLIDAANRILITRRSADSHQGDLWEFPGGKVEAGESVTEALERELREELGTTIGESTPLTEIDFDYGDKKVQLVVRCVRQWSGEPWGAEGQPMAWISRQQLDSYNFPEANHSIVRLLREAD